jgi:alkylation response protein AidB-like acyl-CoA dehydrogenase
VLGTPDQVDRWARPLNEGRLIGAFALTEPGAGSDAAAIHASARRDGDVWVLNGTKAWVSNGGEADLYHVYVKTAPDAGARGISDILVEKGTPGLRFGPPDRKLGANSLPTCQMFFADCRLPAGNLIGPENGAFRLGMAAIDGARVFVGALCAGIGQAALDHAVAYARQRRAFGRAIGEFQGLQWLLADVATEIEAGRLLTYKAAALLDDGRPATLAAAHAKRYGADMALRAASQAMQVFGANGYLRDFPVERYLRWAKMCAYVDGTTQIQQVVIARSLFND